MIFDASVDGRVLRVEVRRANGRFLVSVDAQAIEVDFVEVGRDFASLLVGGRSYEVGLEPCENGYSVHLPDDSLEVQLLDALRGKGALARKAERGPAKIMAPMPGKIVRVMAAAGQEVTAGAGLLVMEAMKMENELKAPRGGRVRQVQVREGQTVETGALLLVLD